MYPFSIRFDFCDDWSTICILRTVGNEQEKMQVFRSALVHELKYSSIFVFQIFDITKELYLLHFFFHHANMFVSNVLKVEPSGNASVLESVLTR